jgi:hypothetical protein
MKKTVSNSAKKVKNGTIRIVVFFVIFFVVAYWFITEDFYRPVARADIRYFAKRDGVKVYGLKKEKGADILSDFVVDKTTNAFVIDSAIAAKVFKKDETIGTGLKGYAFFEQNGVMTKFVVLEIDTMSETYVAVAETDMDLEVEDRRSKFSKWLNVSEK